MCREVKGKVAFTEVLKKSHSRTLEAYTSAEEDHFRELLDPPHTLGINIVLYLFHRNQPERQSLFMLEIGITSLCVTDIGYAVAYATSRKVAGSRPDEVNF
jgi:hypothetical protein